MRILHYLKAIRLKDGGVVRAVLDMCTYQAKAGHEVTLATCDSSDVPEFWKSGSPGHPSVARLPEPGNSIWPNRAFRDAAGALVEKVDVIHLHVLWDPAQQALVRAARARGVPYIQSPHGMLADWSVVQKRVKKLIYYKAFARGLLDHAAFVCTTARGELDQSQKRHPKTPGRAIPLVFDLEPYRQLPAPDAARRQLALPSQDAPTLLYLSRLHFKKRPDLLVAAARAVLDQGLKFNIVFAGPIDDDYRTGLMDYAKSIGVDGITTILGMVPAELKPSLFSACDLFVLPTSMENFGFVYFEALACTTPVLTTKGTDTWRELVDSGGGKIVEMIKSDVQEGGVGGGDTAELSAAMADLIRRREQLRPMGVQGRRWVFDHLEPANIVSQYITMYQHAVAGKRA